MTYLTKDIRDHLVVSTAILDAFSDRIYPEKIPQGRQDAYPAIVINDLSNDPEYTLNGEAGLHTTHVQVDVWTDGTGGKAKANELGELIRNRLSGYRGQFGTGVYGTSRMIRNDTVAAPPIDGSDNHRRRVSMDFEIIHSADVPTFT
jgi:hypothetical protein